MYIDIYMSLMTAVTRSSDNLKDLGTYTYEYESVYRYIYIYIYLYIYIYSYL
jgi:hypothetical protein